MPDRMTVVWVDANGATRGTLLTTSAGAAGVGAALSALSNAVGLYIWEGPLTVNAAPAPVAAQYQSVKDSAVLTYLTSVGDLLTITLVAPVASVFLADQETVDPAAIAALTAAVIASVVDISGNPVVSYVSGVRQSR